MSLRSLPRDLRRSIISEVTPPDVVVMDWRLPMLEPEEFVRWMRAVPRYERVPLIVCSGSAKHCREQALAVGAVACLEKPVDRVQLQAIFEVIS